MKYDMYQFLSSSAGYLSLSSSHTVAWLRCLEAGIAGPNGLPDVPKPDPAWDCIQAGWEWTILAPEVEEAIPTLASWCQMAQNSGNSIGKAINELEVASLLTQLFNQGMDLSQALAIAAQGDLRCRESLPYIASYVQKYAGGSDFPIIHWLTKFGHQFNATLLLGQEFIATLATMEFKDPHQVFPVCRAAIWACMLTTNKASDGFAKLLSKSDLDRLKAPTMLAKIKEAEGMLKDSWQAMETMKAADPEKESHAHKVFGRMAVRSILHLTSKEKHSREEWQWTNLAEIVQSFTDELQHLPTQGPQNAKDLPVADTVNAKPGQLALLQNPHLQLDEQCLGKTNKQ